MLFVVPAVLCAMASHRGWHPVSLALADGGWGAWAAAGVVEGLASPWPGGEIAPGVRPSDRPLVRLPDDPVVDRLPPVPLPVEAATDAEETAALPDGLGKRAAQVQRLPEVAPAVAASGEGVAGAGAPSRALAASTTGEPASGEAAAPAKPGATDDRREPIGEAPPESVNRLLARNTSILLKPGAVQAEAGLTYTLQDLLVLGLLPDGTVTLDRVRREIAAVPFSLRYGWRENTELFGAVPLGLTWYQRDNFVWERRDSSGVLGDAVFGLIHQFPLPNQNLPDTTMTLSCMAPTGAYSLDPLGTDTATLGQGFWQVACAVNLAKAYDPVILLGGLGYQHQFGRDFAGFDIQPGEALTYYFGFGFSMSDDMALSCQLNGAWKDRTTINGIAIANSDRHPIAARIGLLRRRSLKDRVQVFVQAGLTSDAPDVTFGVQFFRDE